MVNASSWKLNDDHSELFFSIEYLNVSEVTGRFKKISGLAEIDQKGMPRSISMKIYVNSVDTGNDMRDGHLKGNEFFQGKVHSQLIFSSNQIQKIGEKKFKALGELQIKKEKKSVPVIFTLTEEVTDTWGYKSRFVKFNSSLKRSDFKLNWNKTLMNEKYLVGDEVKFWGSFQLQPSMIATPTNKHMIPDTQYIREREKINRGEIINQKTSDISAVVKSQKLRAGEKKTIPVALRDEFKDGTFRDSTTWWVALLTLGFLGFISVIIVGYYSKNIFADHFPRKYEENGIIGYATDFIVIIFVLIYSIAFWIVGWGGN
jgi:polyisoprenoid-binding protein YceI